MFDTWDACVIVDAWDTWVAAASCCFSLLALNLIDQSSVNGSLPPFFFGSGVAGSVLLHFLLLCPGYLQNEHLICLPISLPTWSALECSFCFLPLLFSPGSNLLFFFEGLPGNLLYGGGSSWLWGVGMAFQSESAPDSTRSEDFNPIRLRGGKYQTPNPII